MKPLCHLRLLDLTHMLSGPYAAMLLADLGMETIKIEPPGRGEITRRLLADDPQHSLHGMGAYTLTLSRNKKSLALNLKTQAGLELFYELVAISDVVLANFAPGVLERLKIDHPRLEAVNPGIVTCSISGFGETGPDREGVAFDMVVQALGGVMSVTGQPGSPPTRAGLPIADLSAGAMAALGVLSALIARQQTGRGQHVDISMLDTQISLLSYTATMYLLSGRLPAKMGNAHFLHVPYDSYPCRDGYLILAVVADDAWERLMRILPAPDLDTPENRSREGRLKNRARIDQRLSEVLQTRPRGYWLEKLRAARIPSAPVNNYAEALGNPQVLHRNMVAEIEHPLGGVYRAPGNPIKLSRTPAETFTPPARLGEHTRDLLRTLLGKSDAQIAALRREGVIG